ncbi:MAG: QueT transporter family protein [Peptoniphilus sp.]|nr:QueT transporter family protein [Peptoniphilus sp.]MDD7362693.1 QueT transporter family protein [Bacillota bacterium]MDY6044908.1 QueT transporter family protein [Peptoniphilus sp.]
MKRKVTTRWIATTAVLAAIYYALTVVFSPISYGPIQFRVSEVLNLLAFFNPGFAPGIVIGVFLSNLTSPLGVYDLFFGTFHTAISLYFMSKVHKKWVASLMPALFSWIIGFELVLAFGGGLPGFLTMSLSVAASEVIICTLISVPLYDALEKNPGFRSIVNKNPQ